MPEKWQRRYWCDGFVPENYEIDCDSPRIRGQIWIADHQKQECWQFLLLLPRRYQSRENVDWSALLPPENVTRWLSLNPIQRLVEIEPAVAVPDLRANGG
jgi:hypothetical protein